MRAWLVRTWLVRTWLVRTWLVRTWLVRTWLVRTWLAVLAALLSVASASAQSPYPDKPVRFIVGFTAGSATDITARIFAQKFQEAWNVPVTVENVPGAGGSVAGDRVAKSAPDGTTFYWG